MDEMSFNKYNLIVKKKKKKKSSPFHFNHVYIQNNRQFAMRSKTCIANDMFCIKKAYLLK